MRCAWQAGSIVDGATHSTNTSETHVSLASPPCKCHSPSQRGNPGWVPRPRSRHPFSTIILRLGYTFCGAQKATLSSIAIKKKGAKRSASSHQLFNYKHGAVVPGGLYQIALGSPAGLYALVHPSRVPHGDPSPLAPTSSSSACRPPPWRVDARITRGPSVKMTASPAAIDNPSIVVGPITNINGWPQ